MAKILVVEDEAFILEMLQLNLELEGYSVVVADNGEVAKTLILQNHFDALVLDLMLPGVNGIELCHLAKNKNHQIPILILSALDSGDDRIKGLRAGADDYLTKPFRLEEFLIRVQNLLKRNSVQAPSKIKINKAEVDFDAFEILTEDQERISMTKREALFLKMLLDNVNKVVPRESILENLWTMEENPSSRTIDNFILNFRKVFETNPKHPERFLSVRGVGYIYKEKL